MPSFFSFSRTVNRLAASVALGVVVASSSFAQPVLKVLFLGDNGLHKPAERLRPFAPAMMNRGIQVVYTEDASALTLENLKRYDAVLVYANIDTIAPEPEKALLDYVTEGGGLVALHSASASFSNSPKLLALIGAQFQRHDPIASFRTRVATPAHPVAQGFTSFESADEPYVHTKHNEKNRVILEVRESEPTSFQRVFFKQSLLELEGIGRRPCNCYAGT